MAVAGASPTVASSPASLYVGDLHPEVTDSQLYDEFSEFKTLTSVRVCRDSTTGRSLCYGYVNFVAPAEAMRAIEAKNHSRLNGKAIRVMWSHRDPEARRSGVGNVFVKNLPDSIDSGKLEEIFKPFGLVLSCKVAVYDDGKSKGYGFVQFHSDEAANSAIQKLNGSNIEEKEMFVGKFVRKSDRVVSNPNAKYTNLYVKNLDIEVTEESLNEKFSEFGKIVSLAISKDDNGTSRGFGFVNFEKPEDAKRAMEVMNGSQLGSKKTLYVSRAQKKSERVEFLRRQFEERRRERMMKYQGSNVYVKNIDDAATEEELREHFSYCGTITSAKLMKDDKGISKGFGFVCFSTPEEAITAVNTSHGLMFHKKPLYVAIAQRKDERQARLHLQYAQIAGFAGTSSVIPGGYQPVYYTTPLVPPVGQPPMMYQPMGMRPSWRPNGFARPPFQQSPMPMAPVVPRQRQNIRARVGGYTPQYGGSQPPSHALHSHGSSRSTSPKEANAHLGGKSSSNNNNRGRDLNRAAVVSAAASAAPPVPPVPVHEGSEMLSSMLAAASPESRKQILGERLFPLVSQRKPDLAAKVTGMLLEMDNAELLLLLESPESLATKVDEAVEVFKVSKTKVPSSSGEGLHSSFLPASAGVAVN